VYGQRLCRLGRLSRSVRHKDSRCCVDPARSRIGVRVQPPRFEPFQFNDRSAFSMSRSSRSVFFSLVCLIHEARS
jgi:hypothetical protein